MRLHNLSLSPLVSTYASLDLNFRLLTPEGWDHIYKYERIFSNRQCYGGSPNPSLFGVEIALPHASRSVDFTVAVLAGGTSLSIPLTHTHTHTSRPMHTRTEQTSGMQPLLSNCSHNTISKLIQHLSN